MVADNGRRRRRVRIFFTAIKTAEVTADDDDKSDDTESGR